MAEKKAKEVSSEELLAEIEKLKAELAEAKEAPAAASVEIAGGVVGGYNGDELVDYMAPIVGAGADQQKPIFVCVNGESCAIKPGEPVRIKRKFLDALEHASDQRLAAWRYMRDVQASGRKPLAEM